MSPLKPVYNYNNIQRTPQPTKEKKTLNNTMNRLKKQSKTYKNSTIILNKLNI